MNRNLYFISIIAAALRGEDFTPELVAALRLIECKGKERGYEVGHAQFRRLMNLIAIYAAESGAAFPPVDYQLLVDALAELPDDLTATAERIARHQHWRDAFEEMRSQAAGSERFSCCVGVVLCNQAGVLFQSDMARVASDYRIDNIVPGHYRLLLDTGSVLWERDLSRAHLVWRDAFPSVPLLLAADAGGTEQITRIPILKDELFGGRIAIRVWPGVAAGRIELHLDSIDGETPS